MSLAATLPAPVTVAGKAPLAVLRIAGEAERRPLLTPGRLQAILAALSDLLVRKDIALILVTGARGSFCLGADLQHLRHADAAAAERYLRLGQQVMQALATAPVPTIAAVGGPAFGGGFELALACDLRWAHRRAVFALPEAAAGVVPAWGGIATLAGTLPGAAAWELMLGERIGAGRAAALGLVGRLFEGPEFERDAEAAAADLAALGREVLAGLKAIRRAAPDPAAAAACERAVCLARLAGGTEVPR